MEQKEYENISEQIEDKIEQIKDLIVDIDKKDLSESELSEVFNLFDKANSRLGFYIEQNNNFWGNL